MHLLDSVTAYCTRALAKSPQGMLFGEWVSSRSGHQQPRSAPNFFVAINSNPSLLFIAIHRFLKLWAAYAWLHMPRAPVLAKASIGSRG